MERRKILYSWREKNQCDIKGEEAVVFGARK
jgi:hypothetical protein